ncbi:ribonuclease R [Candidatus Parcubacteria bacterium]|nr:ribonuclease R [Candidatus Parcubacteria bacterium]
MPKKVSGHIKITSKVIGYLPVEGVLEDIEIQTSGIKTALNDDEVEVALLPLVKGIRQQGEVTKIIKRARMEFVGTMEKVDDKASGDFFLVPDDKKFYRDILVPASSAGNAQDGDKVFVHITEWKDMESRPRGEVLRVLGKKGVHDVEMQSIVLEKGFDTDFTPEVEEDARKAASTARENFAQEVASRKDFRGTTTFTIDPVDAKDFDDAISFKELTHGDYEIGVHIADVSHFVTEGTVLDKEARKRGFSVYLVDRTIPMLPEELSNDMCSLNPREDKLAFSAVFVMTAKGAVKEKWFGKTVINSNKRFTYENAMESINTVKDGVSGAGEFSKELNILNKIAKIYQEERRINGAIEFETDEVKFQLDAEGVPISVYRKERLDTHKLVEEFMLLANREVAEVVFKVNEKSKDGRAFIYRIHPEPNVEKIENLSIFLKALGFELKSKNGNITSKDINAMLQKISGSPAESLIKTATIRSMAKAIYSTKNVGHFGLGFEFYTHFTSPIRRYPDLIVHRLLQRQLVEGKVAQDEFVKYEKISMDASEKEISAAEAERASIKYKQVEYMSKRVGQEFEGTISGVTEWGIYVEEVTSKSEGMIKLRDMKDDMYELDEKNYAIIGVRTGKKYSLGDKIKFKVLNADLNKKILDFAMV